ncbi:MAG: O-antigen ligase family protein [bacterium]|nr:O-antigen ligase family protein [bacterium]
MAQPKTPAFENKFSYQVLKFLLYLVLFMPLLFWNVFLFPFITTKILFFRFVVEVAALLYVFLAFRYPELRPRFNLLTKSIFIYMAVIFVTSLFGVNFYRSFWGTVERGEGLVSILHFVLYFFILTNVLKIRKDWYRYLFAALIATLINAFYGLGQLLQLEFLTNTTGGRIAGTIGNPSFFAAYLMYGVFIGLYLLYETPKESAKRWFIIAVVTFDFFMVYKTATRGSMIAVIVAFLLYLILKIFLAGRKRTKLYALAFFLLLLGAGILAYQNRDSSLVQSNTTLRRLAKISIDDKTTQSRIDTWRASSKGWQDRLISGYGYENFNIAFNKYFPARIFKTNNSQIWFDRAHNIFFDVAVTSGILGLGAYAFVFLTAIFYTIKLYRKDPADPDSFKYLVLFLGLVVFLVQNLFVFDTQATYLMFYLFLAALAGFYQIENPREQKSKMPGFSLGYVLGGIVVLIFLFSNYFVNWQPARANHFAIVGIQASKLKQYKDLLPNFKKSLGYGTYMDEEIRQRLVDSVLEAVSSGQLTSEEQTEILRYAIDELRANHEQNPGDVRNHLYLISIMNRSQGYFPNLVDEAIALAKEALELSPTRPQIYFELGQSYFFKQNYEDGLAAFQKAITLNPEPKESHLNYLLATIISGRKDLEAEELKEIQRRNLVFNIDDHNSIARAYMIAKNTASAIESYLKTLELDPKNTDQRIRLAQAYGEICDQESAKREIGIVTDLNQGFILQGQEFLRELETKCQK